MSKRSMAILFVLFAALAGAWAQDADEGVETWTGGERWPEEGSPAARPSTRNAPAPLVSESYPNALGFSFGSDISPISVFNLHYQGWIGDLGIAANLGAMRGMDFTEGSFGVDVLGAFQYKVSDGNLIPDGNVYGALYVFAQLGYVGIQTEVYDEATSTFSPVWRDYIPLGVGIGIEGVLFKHFSVPMEVGFKVDLMELPIYFGPTFTTAIRYRF